MKLLPAFLLLSLLFSLSFQSDYNPKTAFEMLRASTASYCSDAQLKSNSCGAVCKDLASYGYHYILQFVHQISSSQSVSYSLFVNPNQKRYVVAFRGSSSTQQILDEIVNGGSVTYDMHSISKAVATKYFYSHYKDDLRTSLLTNLKQAKAQYPGYQFFFTGHSLGGAFATLAIIDVVLEGLLPKSQVHMYNYGSPRVGNMNLVQAVEENIKGELFRAVHWKDIVPHVPPCVADIHGICQNGDKKSQEGEDNLLYYAWHVGPEIFYNQDSSSYKVCTRNEDPACADQFALKDASFSDHSMYLGVSTNCGGNGAFEQEESLSREFLRKEIW